MKDTVSHYVPPYSPLTSTEPQVFSNNLTMPFRDRGFGDRGLIAERFGKGGLHVAHRQPAHERRDHQRLQGIVKLLLVWCCQDWSVAIAARYKGYRYPIEVIGHAVWLYHRFALSLRDVEELMLARGLVVTYETIRSWCASSGRATPPNYVGGDPAPATNGHFDEVFVKINGATHYLWRAVDQHGDVLDILVQSRRNAVAAKRFFRKLLKGLRCVPRVLVTDKLASYQVAHRELLPSVTHRRSKYLNNRAENSHQPTRIRERVMKRFASPGQAQRFLFAFSHIRQHFRPRRHLISAPQWRTQMTNRFAVWDEITVAAAA